MMRVMIWVTMVLAFALVFTGCGGNDDDGSDISASNQTEGGDNSNSAIQCDPCAATFTEVLDSSARCGYRCVPMPDEDADAGLDCVRECPDGFRVQLNPQNECGFFCEPLPRGDDGEEFLFDVGVDAEGGDVGEDADPMDAELMDADEEDVVDEDAADEDAAGEGDVVDEDATDDVDGDAVDLDAAGDADDDVTPDAG